MKNIDRAILSMLPIPKLTGAWVRSAVEQTIWKVNGKQIPVENMLLINPAKFKNVRVSSPTDFTYQFDIDTDCIDFINYNGLKARACVPKDQRPKVFIDGRPYKNKGLFRIDKTYIKEILWLNDAIQVTTKNEPKEALESCEREPNKRHLHA